MNIPFMKPGLGGRELAYIEQAINNGHISSSGPFSQKVINLLSQTLGASDVLLTTSCTDALEMSAMLLNLTSEDTVLVPSFTFTSTALAFARQGANIRFCDIESTTFGIDPAEVERHLDDSVKAVVPVHYAGIGCDINGLTSALSDYPDVAIIEDNAHGLFGSYEDKPLGSFGRFSTLSFHETKNFICGEGGALVLNDPADIDRAHIIFDKGTNRREFLLGNVDKYSWQDTGSSFGMSELLAAFLLAQLEEAERILTARAVASERYNSLLAPYVAELGISLPIIPGNRSSAHHMFYVMLPSRSVRNTVLAQMNEAGINATFHYVPLHSSPAGRRFSRESHSCPVSTDVSDRLLRLPLYNNIETSQISRVVTVFLEATKKATAPSTIN
jgi:dTDP-4-amino-4,6-dideoxygalactose transaminase